MLPLRLRHHPRSRLRRPRIPLGSHGPTELRKRVSTARCARVSYLTHDGVRDIEADLTLYDRLVTADPGHWSPLEHVATPCVYRTTPYGSEGCRPGHHLGNFHGWDQLRHQIEAAR